MNKNRPLKNTITSEETIKRLFILKFFIFLKKIFPYRPLIAEIILIVVVCFLFFAMELGKIIVYIIRTGWCENGIALSIV